MFLKNRNIKLLELIDVKLLQDLQDNFAKLLGIASIIVDDNGPITEPSNFTEFCIKYTRNSSLGYERCNQCDINWGKIAAQKGTPQIYNCHAGLTDFAIPIMVDGVHIASILGGQILTEKPDEEKFRQVANELGIDVEEYVGALRKIKVIPFAKLNIAVNFLSIFANTISQLAYKNLILLENNKREEFGREVIGVIRSTLNINETKQKIVDIIGKKFNADRCFIMEYNNELNKFLPVEKEYLSSSNIMSYKGIDVDSEVPKFAQNLKKGKNVLINNKEIVMDVDLSKFSFEKEAIDKWGVKSAFAIPLFYSGEFLGAVALHFVEEQFYINEDNITVLTMIADQIAIAIHHAKLFEAQQKTLNREQVLRTTMDLLRTQIDSGEIIKKFLEIISNYFNADRFLFAKYNSETNKFSQFVLEKLKTPDAMSFLNFDIEKEFPLLAERVKNGKDVRIKDVEAVFKRKKVIKQIKAIETLIHGDTKSDYAVGIVYENKLFGAFVMHFTSQKKALTNDEMGFLKALVNQAAVALYQAELFEKEKNAAERESILRSITEKIRSSLDIEETLTFICEATAKMFNVQRVAISSFSLFKKYDDLTVRKEYVVSTDMSKILDAKEYLDVVNFWNNKIMEIGKVFSIDNINEADVPDFLKKVYNDMGVKSLIGLPIKEGDNVWGILVLSEYNKFRSWDAQDKELLESIADEIYIALNQAELFEKEKRSAEREKLINKIFENALRALDINQMKLIVSDIGMITKADRCYFVEAETKIMKGKPISSDFEYLASSDIKSIVGYKFDIESIKKFLELYLEKKDLVVFDYEGVENNPESDLREVLDYSKYSNLKSGVGIPFFYMGELLAVLCIEYVNEKVLPSDEELEFLRILGHQVGMVYSQIKNYQGITKMAQRENILRRVIETVRSSFDLNEVKKKIVNELGSIFGADRCYFRSYDKINEKILPVDTEYVASDDIKSLVGVEPDQGSLMFFVDEVKKAKKRFYPTIVNQESAKGTPLESYMNLVDIKADYAMPIVDREDELIWLVLHYSKEDPKFSEGYNRLLETIAYQIDIAFDQIKLYNTIKTRAKKEILLRTIMDAVRSSIDVDEVKNQTVNIIGKILNADRCFIMDYDKVNDTFVKSKNDYLSVGTNSIYDEENSSRNVPNFINAFMDKKSVLIKNKQIFIDGKKQFDLPESGVLDNFNVVSAYALPMYYMDDFYGVLSVHYLNPEHEFDDEEIELMDIIVGQISIAIHQANLFKTTKMQAEREKISRNIIEILRSSIDKNTIKRLFVKNIGKYFNADRVLFSEYDQNERMYLPVDEFSEYLSSSQEASFIGYDWSNPSAIEYIQPLLEKRELNIFDWKEYIQNNQKGQDFIRLFEDANVKSSYNFPVLYQDKIMGYFCIEFTKEVHRMAQEDIGRIRSICTQAGIALYQAELYQKTQEADREKGEFIEDIAQKLKGPLNNIIEIAERLPRETDNCYKQIEDLNDISKNGKKLLDLSAYIQKISENDKFNS